jgi:hypothetical protein
VVELGAALRQVQAVDHLALAHIREDALQLELPARQARIVGAAQALHFLDAGLHQARRGNVARIAQFQRIGLAACQRPSGAQRLAW